MVAAQKISLPTCYFDSNKQEPKVSNVLYDLDSLRDKNVRNWQDGGRDCPDKCAIFHTDSGKDRFVVIAMSIDKLIEKMVALSIWKVVK